MDLFKYAIILLILPSISSILCAHEVQQTKNSNLDPFRQLGTVLPTPNVYRNAGGQPGPNYWQQKVDYDIKVTVNEEKRSLAGEETIIYHNNSPDTLRYLWMQLDQNIFRNDSVHSRSATYGEKHFGQNRFLGDENKHFKHSLKTMQRRQYLEERDAGVKVLSIKDRDGKKLLFHVYGTQLRIDLPKPLKSHKQFTFHVKFVLNLVDENTVWARSGYEHFPDDKRKGGNYILQAAQWYPRLAAYSDYEAWHNKEFLGRGEFTLEFGDFKVSITAPKDHIIASTGTLKNPEQVLTPEQIKRLKKAKNSSDPVYIVTPEEALKNESSTISGSKTWVFQADNVRDFAFASSRKFIWDALGMKQDSSKQPLVMAMSFYPKEGDDLWKKYSTRVITHTLQVYSRFTFKYPYPVAISVNGPVGGMEYPMITFNGPRTKLRKDGTRTYPLSEKRFLLGVVIHEIGHNFFPMIVNSDERQWTWMDEGINSFLDGIACREWDPNIPWGIEPRDIIGYMTSSNQVPIMTQSDSIYQFGNNAYAKPAVAFNVLREVVMGRERFDFALKEYAKTWMNRHPTPADFFRIMEEASGLDLDWFWRGWFYTTDHVDIGLEQVYELTFSDGNPDIDYPIEEKREKERPESLFEKHNREEGRIPWVTLNPQVKDYYDEHNQYTVTNKDRHSYLRILDNMPPDERRFIEDERQRGYHYYVLEFTNRGGLVMPILLEFTFKNGDKKELHIPAEIWRISNDTVYKLLTFKEELAAITIDPHEATADANISNNHFPRKMIPSRLEWYKNRERQGKVYRDIMHDSREKDQRDLMQDSKQKLKIPKDHIWKK